jgi:hypothetical protein
MHLIHRQSRGITELLDDFVEKLPCVVGSLVLLCPYYSCKIYRMKKSMFLLMAAASVLLGLSCGPSAAEQEKAKQEILQIEASQNAVDSTEKAVAKTAAELDSLLKLLNAN